MKNSLTLIASLKRLLLPLLVAICFFPSLVSALPIGWTTGTVNGANVIVDTAGNQWLSPTNTLSQTFVDAQASVWVTDFGFQAATLGQFNSLLDAYGLVDPRDSDYSTDTTGDGYISNCCDDELLFTLGNEAAVFFADFGPNLHDPGAFYGPEDHSFGYLASSETYPTVLVGQVRLLNRNGDLAGGMGNFTQNDGASSLIGTWLIAPSASVPEPTSIILLSLGLLGVGMRRRQIHQR